MNGGVAVITDIHANLPALEASLQRIEELGIERVYCGGDLLVFGHTHKPWIREHGGVVFVNCGSVGKPKDGDPRAAFAVLTPTDQGVRATIERADYDAQAVAREVAAAGLPEEYADKLVAAA